MVRTEERQKECETVSDGERGLGFFFFFFNLRVKFG